MSQPYITIQEALPEHAPAMASLSRQMGYETSDEIMQKRLNTLSTNGNDIAYVAIQDTEVIGWMHVYFTLRLETDPFYEIGGLIVDAEHRHRGVGKMLLGYARQWCGIRSCRSLKIRSNMVTSDAQQFYLKAGFMLEEEQKVFVLQVG
ncbi:MAG: GNAT family N-acetyltransferase [Sphingobacteriales bacterium]|nr:MAG: GNAT family N-acetyltransferase [Sphingobacteriales bacterium]